MTKPDDIPQDVWDVAAVADAQADAAWGEALDGPQSTTLHSRNAAISVIARAIMAEREACARIVASKSESFNHTWLNDAFEQATAAIRNRGAA